MSSNIVQPSEIWTPPGGGAIWTPEEEPIIIPEKTAGAKLSAWKRDAAVDEMIRELDERKYRTKNWDKISPGERFSALSKAEYGAVVEQADLCAEDFSYAARNYFWITDNDGKDLLMTLWEAQYLILQKYYELKARGIPQKIYILKARQLGSSTLAEAMIAWRTMFFPNINALVVSVDAPHAAYVFGLALHIIDHMPWWLKPEVASREEKNGIWFDNPDEEDRAVNPGLNSHIFVQWSTQGSGLGQGRKILGCHVTELTDWYDDHAREGIEGDLKEAVKDSVEAFWLVETTGKESGTYSHRLWRGCEELGEEALLYPLFLPWFFESSRKRKPPEGWMAKKQEIGMREKVKLAWVRCDSCSQYFSRSDHGRDRDGESCRSCKVGTIRAVVLSDDQIYWREVRRRQAEKNGREAVIETTRELASTAEESFLAGGISVFPLECQERVMATIQDPDKVAGIKVGFFDTQRIHNPRFHGLDGNNEDRNNPGKYFCYLPECRYDHTGDADQFNVIIWEDPIPGVSYQIGVDVAEGLGQNYSVIFVNKIGGANQPDEQVATMRDNRIDTIPLAYYCVLLGYYYNTGQLAIEYEGIGKSTADAVRHVYQYENIYQWKHMDSKNIFSQKFHWYTKPDTRQKLWQTARHWIRSGAWVIRSKNFLHEMQTFQKDGDNEDAKRADHAPGENDDLLMAGMIALYTAHEGEADERGVIRSAMMVDSGPINPRYLMICQNPECGSEFGAENPEQVYRCPQCKCVNLIGKRLEVDVNQPGVHPKMAANEVPADSILDLLGKEAPPRADSFDSGLVDWANL